MLYLLLDELLCLLAARLLKSWLAGGGAGASAAAYEVRIWAASLAAGVLALLVPVAAAVHFGRLTRRQMALRCPARHILLPALCVYLGASELGNLVAGVVGDSTGSMQTVSLPGSLAARLLAFCTICVVPAVLEELLFRGVCQGLLRPYGAWVSIVGQVVLFALLHQKWSAVAFALPAGLFLGWLAEYTQSLAPGMLLHGINNSLAFAMLYLSAVGLGSAADMLAAAELIVFPLLAAVVVVSCLWQKKKLCPLRGGKPAWALLRSIPWDITVAVLLFYCAAGIR